VAFTVSLGANDRAEANWILPLVCRRGDITRREVGAIRVDRDRTFVEVAAAAAERFAANAAEVDPRAPHVRIERAEAPMPTRSVPTGRTTHPAAQRLAARGDARTRGTWKARGDEAPAARGEAPARGAGKTRHAESPAARGEAPAVRTAQEPVLSEERPVPREARPEAPARGTWKTRADEPARAETPTRGTWKTRSHESTATRGARGSEERPASREARPASARGPLLSEDRPVPLDERPARSRSAPLSASHASDHHAPPIRPDRAPSHDRRAPRPAHKPADYGSHKPTAAGGHKAGAHAPHKPGAKTGKPYGRKFGGKPRR
jgi:ATP-dependent RNA helicase DeaD